jgi:DNA polymerase (family 10)
MQNSELANRLEEVADLLEIENANPFRIRAYRNAARTVETLSEPIVRKLEAGEPLTGLPAIGKEMASHLQSLVTSGSFAERDQLLSRVPPSLLVLMRLPGLGPKKARKLFDELGIASVEALEEAAQAGRIAAVAGFGAKSQEKILAGITDFRRHTGRFLIDEVERQIAPLLAYLREEPALERLEVAGSYRRRKETVGDVDLLAIASPTAAVMARFLSYAAIDKTLMSGDTRSSIVLRSGLQVDLRAVPAECYGAALVYFTGSKAHNVKLRVRALDRGLHLSEYGLFRTAGKATIAEGELVASREESDVYAALDLPWIPPELREDLGEIEAAARLRQSPRLLETGDLRGDLHLHSVWSDGRSTLEEMVVACAARGYEYMAISDHSQALAMVQGLDAARLRLQWAEIEAVRQRHPEIHLLRGLEVDILTDGSLDLEDEMLAGLDWVIVSVHSRFDLPAAEQTERILKAIRHPAVNVLAHPTGRLINRRKPFDFDLEAVLREAARLGVAVELNSNPHRLDLKDTHLRRAKELGCPLVIDTDAHHTDHLALMRFGVDQARRAGLEAKDVLNALPLAEFLSVLKSR